MGIRPVGLKALSSLRMEKAYRDYGHDIDNTDNLAMVGLGFAVAKDKPAPWIGRGPTLAALAAALRPLPLRSGVAAAAAVAAPAAAATPSARSAEVTSPSRKRLRSARSASAVG